MSDRSALHRFAVILISAGMAAALAPSLAQDQPTRVLRTPPGVECRKGILDIEARSKTEFVVEGESVTRKQLRKALRKARKSTPFDCLVINGGHPATEDVMQIIVDLSPMRINHVEWTGFPSAPSP